MEPEPIGRGYLVKGRKISEEAYDILVEMLAPLAVKVAYPNSGDSAIFILKYEQEFGDPYYRVVWLNKKGQLWLSDPLDIEDAIVLFGNTLDLETDSLEEVERE